MYTIKDISKMTKLTTRTIQNHLKLGYLKGHKIGRSWRFSEDNIKNYFNHQEVSTQLIEENNQLIKQFLADSTAGACLLLNLSLEETQARHIVEEIQEFIINHITEGLTSYRADYLSAEKILKISVMGKAIAVMQIGNFIKETNDEGLLSEA